MTLYRKSCECGCGVEFDVIPQGGSPKRFSSNRCRARSYAKRHLRYITDARPRTARKFSGCELQLSDAERLFLDQVQIRRKHADRSYTARVLLRWCRSRLLPSSGRVNRDTNNVGLGRDRGGATHPPRDLP